MNSADGSVSSNAEFNHYFIKRMYMLSRRPTRTNHLEFEKTWTPFGSRMNQYGPFSYFWSIARLLLAISLFFPIPFVGPQMHLGQALAQLHLGWPGSASSTGLPRSASQRLAFGWPKAGQVQLSLGPPSPPPACVKKIRFSCQE